MKKVAPEDAHSALMKIARNATLWWLDKRPAGWDEKRHMENPAVNCSNARELDIALAVSEFVKLNSTSNHSSVTVSKFNDTRTYNPATDKLVEIKDPNSPCVNGDNHRSVLFADASARCGSCGRRFENVIAEEPQ